MTILGMLAVSIILFLIGAQNQMIFLVGLGIMVFGVLFFYLRAKGMAMAPKAVLGCGIYAFVWGGLVAVTPFVERMFPMAENYFAWVFTEGFGGMFLALGVRGGILLPLQCNRKVTATLSNVHKQQGSKGRTYYQPEFTYCYENGEYCQRTSDILSKRKLKRRYELGQNYTIYVHPKNPRLICMRRRPEGSAVLMLAMGLLIMLVPIGMMGS